MKEYVAAGIDIGGTKCAVTLNRVSRESVTFLDKMKFDTPKTYAECRLRLFKSLDLLLSKNPSLTLDAIGISCGGPLDSKKGVVLCPPNLPDWKDIFIVEEFGKKYKTKAFLQNDANAGALAEWYWGSGKGLENMIFLTFGTGMGSGLILNSRLYSGTCDMAGEVGHLRLAKDGPVGFYKAGSFEGFCSGGGIQKLAVQMVSRWLSEGEEVSFCKDYSELEHISAKTVAIAARNGDKKALKIYQIVAEKLGEGLALLIDILNPQRIVIGSIYARDQALFDPTLYEVLRREAIPYALGCCEIQPASLSEQIGDYAACAVAIYGLENEPTA